MKIHVKFGLFIHAVIFGAVAIVAGWWRVCAEFFEAVLLGIEPDENERGEDDV